MPPSLPDNTRFSKRRFLRLSSIAGGLALTAVGVFGTGSSVHAQPVGMSAELGIVTTVAGPGFCSGATVVDPGSLAVGAITTDATGVVHFDVGGTGRVVRVEGTGRTTVVPTRTPAGGAGGTGDQVAGRLAGDGDGGVLVGAETAVLSFSPGRVVVAGDPRASGETAKSSGDGGLAVDARFTRVSGVEADEAGNAFVADAASGGGIAVRFVNRGEQPVTFFAGTPQSLTIPPGNIDTVVGLPGQPAVGDVQPARTAAIKELSAMAVSRGRLYLADFSATGPQSTPRGRVRMANLGGTPVDAHGKSVPSGAITTVAEGGTADTLPHLAGMGADTDGNLYLPEDTAHQVLRIDAAGTVTTFAGTGGSGGYNGNSRPATTARLNRPSGVAVGTNGRVYVADRGNRQVRVVEGNGTMRAAFGNGAARAGQCQAEEGSTGNGPLEAEEPDTGSPSGVAADPNGDVYITLAKLGYIVRLTPSGVATTVAGGGSDPADGAEARRAELNVPTSVAVAPGGLVYFVENEDSRLRVVNLGTRRREANGVRVDPGKVVTLARDLHFADPAAGAELRHGTGLAVDSAGNVFVGEGRSVRHIDPGGTASTVLPSGSNRCCEAPAGLALDTAGNLYVADVGTAKVWLLNRGATPLAAHGQTIPQGEARPVAGNGEAGFSGDGDPALSAQLSGLAGLAVDRTGNLYIATPSTESDNSVRKVDSVGTIATLVGGTQKGFNGDLLPASLTGLGFPADVAIDRCGNLLVADRALDRIRRVSLVDSCDQAGSASPGRLSRSPRLLAAAIAGLLVAALLWRRRSRSRAQRSSPTSSGLPRTEASDPAI